MSREVDDDKRATLRRFAALGATAPFVSGEAAADGREARSDVREAIAGYLSRTPGAHFSKLRDDLRLGTGEAQHHLRRLESADAIDSWRDGDYRRFAPADRFGSFEQTALGYLRRETPRGMVVGLLRDPEATGTQLADELGVSRATVSGHASELASVGLLDREGGYRVRQPATVAMLLVQYADSFGPEAVAFAREADQVLSYDP